jgi:hypothetical protein
MYPKDVVEWLRDANGGDKDQGPLKDAPGGLPAEVVAKLHSKAAVQAAGAGATGSVDEKPAAPPKKKRVANKPDDSAEASAIH